MLVHPVFLNFQEGGTAQRIVFSQLFESTSTLRYFSKLYCVELMMP